MSRSPALAALCILGLVAACASSSGAKNAETSSQPSGQKQKPAAASDPLGSLALMRQGSVLLQQGRVEAALETFQQADRTAPGNPTNKNMIGLCQLNLGRFDQALESFNAALDLAPGFIDARNNRGATYLAMKQLHLAEVDFLAVLGDSTYPYRKQAYYNLGLTYLQQGQYGAAEENFRKAIALPNPVFDAYLQLAKLAQLHGELERARVLLEEARLQYPDRPEVSLELGKLFILMGDSASARPHLERVIADAPDSADAATARALLGQG